MFSIDAANGSGPRIQLGTQFSPSTFLELGAYSNQNNFDTKNRNMQIFGTGFPGIMINATTGNVGISSTSPFAVLSVQANAFGTYKPTIFAIASSTPTATTTLYSIDSAGHHIASSTAPTLSSGTVDGTDNAGVVSSCTSACTVTFAQAWPKAPACSITPYTGSITNTLSYTVSATAIVVTETSLGTFKYQCGIGI